MTLPGTLSASPATSTYPPADLERRFLAFLLDRVVAWALYAAAAWAAWWFFLSEGRWWAGAGVVVGAVVVVVLASAAALGVTGTSPGRAAFGLRVVDSETGSPVGFVPALLRTVVLGLATLPTVGLGVATLAWTALMDDGRQRRGWHDRLAGSVVVDVRPQPEAVDEEPDQAPRQIVNLTAMRLVPAGAAVPTPAPEAPAARPGAGVDTSPSGRRPERAQEPTPERTPEPPAASPTPPTPPPPPTPPAATPPAPAEAAATPPAPAPAPPAAPVPTPAPAPASSAAAGRQQLQGPLRSPDAERPAGDRARGRHRGRGDAAPPAGPGPATSVGWRVTFDTGESFVVEGLVLVGRKPEPRPSEQVRHLVALASQDMSLSKTHAQLHLADGVLVAMDRGSTNGSVLNRRGVARDLVAHRPATLVDGDRVRFGDREMRVEKAR